MNAEAPTGVSQRAFAKALGFDAKRRNRSQAEKASSACGWISHPVSSGHPTLLCPVRECVGNEVRESRVVVPMC